MRVEEYDILGRPSPEVASQATDHAWSYLRSDGDPRSYKSFEVERLAERGWVAVPVAHYPEEPQIEHLATHARRNGVDSAIAVVTESTSDVFVVFFRLRHRSLERIGAVLPTCDRGRRREGRFALLYDGSYFSVLAGPQGLVESVLDKPLEIARDDFRNYVNRLVYDGAAFRAWLLDEVDRYAAPTAT